MKPDHAVAVIGGGQAGLAVAYYLRRAGLDFRVFDSGDRPGGAFDFGRNQGRGRCMACRVERKPFALDGCVRRLAAGGEKDKQGDHGLGGLHRPHMRCVLP